MMCSLVTSTCGETRYMGMEFARREEVERLSADWLQDFRRDSLSSRPKACSGSTERPGTRLSKT